MVQVIRVNGEEIALNKLSHVSDGGSRGRQGDMGRDVVPD